MQQERDAIIQDRRDQDLFIRELQHTINWLRGELSQAAIRVEEEVDRGRAVVASERRLKAVVDEQKVVIQRYVQDKEAPDRRIQELEASQNNANPTPIPRNSPPPAHNTRPSKRRRQQSPDMEQQVSRVKRQPVDSATVPNNIRREVPGLLLVEDDNVTDKVIEKLFSIMERPNGKKNMESFLNECRYAGYFCVHEAASKGKYASNRLLPSQFCRGCPSTIRVKKVWTDSGVKLQVGHFTMKV